MNILLIITKCFQIGYKDMWYGKPDMVLFADGINESSVVAPIDMNNNFYWTDVNNHDNGEKTQVFEMESNRHYNLRLPNTVRQSVAQCITFSMYQGNLSVRNPHLHKAPMSLIPTITISLDEFDVYMYDHDYDVLLSNDGYPIDLWCDYEQELRISSVIQLWMVVNHALFKANLQPIHIEKMEDSCEFRKHCGENFEIYKNRVMYIPNFNFEPMTPCVFNKHEKGLVLYEEFGKDLGEEDMEYDSD